MDTAAVVPAAASAASNENGKRPFPSQGTPILKKRRKMTIKGGRWSVKEDRLMRTAVKTHGTDNWEYISVAVFSSTRSQEECRSRWEKVLRKGLVKGPWTKEEDDTVIRMVNELGVDSAKWTLIAEKLNGRVGKQARERWYNHLDPTLSKLPWTSEETEKMIELQKVYGNRWSKIATFLPGRSENTVKNRWNSAARRNGYVPKRKSNGNRARAPVSSKLALIAAKEPQPTPIFTQNRVETLRRSKSPLPRPKTPKRRRRAKKCTPHTARSTAKLSEMEELDFDAMGIGLEEATGCENSGRAMSPGLFVDTNVGSAGTTDSGELLEFLRGVLSPLPVSGRRSDSISPSMQTRECRHKLDFESLREAGPLTSPLRLSRCSSPTQAAASVAAGVAPKAMPASVTGCSGSGNGGLATSLSVVFHEVGNGGCGAGATDSAVSGTGSKCMLLSLEPWSREVQAQGGHFDSSPAAQAVFAHTRSKTSTAAKIAAQRKALAQCEAGGVPVCTADTLRQISDSFYPDCFLDTLPVLACGRL